MIRRTHVGQNVDVMVPGRGVWYPAKVIGYSSDHNSRLESVDCEIRDGYRFAANHVTVNIEASSNRIRRGIFRRHVRRGKVMYD